MLLQVLRHPTLMIAPVLVEHPGDSSIGIELRSPSPGRPLRLSPSASHSACALAKAERRDRFTGPGHWRPSVSRTSKLLARFRAPALQGVTNGHPGILEHEGFELACLFSRG